MRFFSSSAFRSFCLFLASASEPFRFLESFQNHLQRSWSYCEFAVGKDYLKLLRLSNISFYRPRRAPTHDEVSSTQPPDASGQFIMQLGWKNRILTKQKTDGSEQVPKKIDFEVIQISRVARWFCHSSCPLLLRLCRLSHDRTTMRDADFIPFPFFS